jgi:hypothetical protein
MFDRNVFCWLLAATLLGSTASTRAAESSTIDGSGSPRAMRTTTSSDRSATTRTPRADAELADDDTPSTDGDPTDSMADAFFRVLGFYFNHKDAIDQSVSSVWHNWYAAPSERIQAASVVQNLLDATSALTVEQAASPCAGPNTVQVRYHLDGSRDCVNPAATHSVKLSDAELLFIDTVDANGNRNNAMVYQYVADARTATFLGTVTALDHPGFKLEYEDGRVIASFDNADQTRTNCLIGWVNEKFRETCQ